MREMPISDKTFVIGAVVWTRILMNPCKCSMQHTHMYVYIYIVSNTQTLCVEEATYGVASISRLLEIIGLFCKRAL